MAVVDVGRAMGGSYLLVQGVGAMAWWVGLATSATLRDLFVAEGGWPAARTVLLADVVLVGGLSVLVGVLGLARDRRASVGALVLVGAMGYATLVAAAWTRAPVERWLGVVIMAPALVATAAVAGMWNREERLR